MGKKRKKKNCRHNKKSSAKWFRPVLPVKKAQEKKIWRGECSNVPKKSKSGVGKKKSCVPCACGASMYPTNVDHQQNIFKIGNPSGEPGIIYQKKKKKKKKKKKNQRLQPIFHPSHPFKPNATHYATPHPSFFFFLRIFDLGFFLLFFFA